MSFVFEYEYELNRGWIYDDKEEVIGETNFVVPNTWLRRLFQNKYANIYDSFEEFINVYEPEVEGEFIYQKAIKDGVLKEDLGIVMY